MGMSVMLYLLVTLFVSLVSTLPALWPILCRFIVVTSGVVRLFISHLPEVLPITRQYATTFETLISVLRSSLILIPEMFNLPLSLAE